MFYGWVIAFAGFLISVIGFGGRYSYGIFLQSLEMEFEISRTAASTIFSANMLISSVIAFTAGCAMDRYGPRALGIFIGIFTTMGLIASSLVTAPWQLLITYSLLVAMGTGGIYGTVNATVSRWFIAKRGLAIGFSSSGGGVGIILVAPLTSYLVLNYSWRMAFTLLGILSGVVILLMALLLKRDPSDLGLFPDGASSVYDKSGRPVAPKLCPNPPFNAAGVFKTRQLWQLGLIWITISIGLHMVIVHVVPYAIANGIPAMKAALIMGLMGLANICGRLLIGRLSDQLGRKAIGALCAVIQSGTLLFLIWAKGPGMFYVFAVIFGLMWGGIGTIMTALVGDVFGMGRIGMIMGITSSLFALGAAIGPALGGIIFDSSGHYTYAFALSAGGLLIAAGIVSLIKPLEVNSINDAL